MTRTHNGFTRMDVDTGWPYHRRVRRLQQAEPERWPTYWCAYLALLGEAWRSGNRMISLADGWCPALPCEPREAEAALRAAGIVDAQGRIPKASWDEWFGTAAQRIEDASRRGREAAQKRWQTSGNADAMPAHSGRNARAMPRPARPPSPPAQRAPTREGGPLKSLKDVLVDNGLADGIVE